MRTFYFAAFLAIGMHAPFFPLWLEAHGFRGVSMSAIAALSPALSALGPPLVGAVADARGARGNLLGVVCALACLGMAALCVVEASGHGDVFGLVFACVFLFALCRSPILLLADRIALEAGGNYGRRRLWGSLGFLIGAGGFGRVVAPADWHWLPGIVALALGVAYLASLRLPRVSSAPVAPALGEAWRLLKQRRFALLLVGSATFAAGHASYDLCSSLYFRDLGAGGDTIGLLWVTGVVAEILVMALAAPWFGKVHPERWLLLAYGIGAVRWLAMAYLPNAGLAFVLQPLHGVSFGLVWLSSLEVLERAAGPRALGGAQGLLMAANAVGGTLGIMIFGPLYAARGGGSVFLVAACLALAAALLGRFNLVQREWPVLAG
jgi:PPP family 3-phenylpropionic acid transporter